MPYSDRERQRSYQHEHYLKNKVKWQERRSAVKRHIKQEIIEYKESRPCVDCGEFYPYFVMDLDHLGDKVERVSRLVSKNASRKRVFEEIAKCELVCANCHRYRTQSRGQRHT